MLQHRHGIALLVSTFALTVLAATGCDKTPDKPTAYQGEVFAAELPAGYKLVSGEMRKKMEAAAGAAMVAAFYGKRKRANEFLPTFVVTSVPGSGAELHSLESCQLASEQLTAAVATEPGPVRELKLPLGKTCQFEMGSKEQFAVQTVVYLGDEHWVVTCNMDPKHVERRAECDSFLRSFRKPDPQ